MATEYLIQCLYKGTWDKTQWHDSINPHYRHGIIVIPSLNTYPLWLASTRPMVSALRVCVDIKIKQIIETFNSHVAFTSKRFRLLISSTHWYLWNVIIVLFLFVCLFFFWKVGVKTDIRARILERQRNSRIKKS